MNIAFQSLCQAIVLFTLLLAPGDTDCAGTPERAVLGCGNRTAIQSGDQEYRRFPCRGEQSRDGKGTDPREPEKSVLG
jgi:hypothetical protein